MKKINCKGLETDMLWDLADHAQAEIDRWNSVLNRVLAQLATLVSFPPFPVIGNTCPLHSPLRGPTK